MEAKRVLVIALVAVCGMAFSDCFARKPRRQKLSPEEIEAKLDSLRNEQEKLQNLINEIYETGPLRYNHVPCTEESYDTDEEIRGLGIAEGATPEQAKENAYRVAMEQIIAEMPHHIKSVTISYPDGSTYSETVAESSLTGEQKQAVYSNSQIYCIKYENTQEGICRAYVAVSVPKEKIMIH